MEAIHCFLEHYWFEVLCSIAGLEEVASSFLVAELSLVFFRATKASRIWPICSFNWLTSFFTDSTDAPRSSILLRFARVSYGCCRNLAVIMFCYFIYKRISKKKLISFILFYLFIRVCKIKSKIKKNECKEIGVLLFYFRRKKNIFIFFYL